MHLETTDEKQAGSPGTRAAEDILVRLKNEDGSYQEVPLLLILADLFNQLAAIKMKLAVIEPIVLQKDKRIVTV
jgi:hypothetical protein